MADRAEEEAGLVRNLWTSTPRTRIEGLEEEAKALRLRAESLDREARILRMQEKLPK